MYPCGLPLNPQALVLLAQGQLANLRHRIQPGADAAAPEPGIDQLGKERNPLAVEIGGAQVKEVALVAPRSCGAPGTRSIRPGDCDHRPGGERPVTDEGRMGEEVGL